LRIAECGLRNGDKVFPADLRIPKSAIRNPEVLPLALYLVYTSLMKKRALSEPITVITYAGYRGEETPRAFLFDGVRIDVLSVIETRVEETAGTRVHLRRFVVAGSDGRTHTLVHDEELGIWTHREP
jgi:hypothetical protein